MQHKLAILSLVFILGSTTVSCGPAAVEEYSAANTSNEASQFRKAASGIWQSSCLAYTEDASIRSDVRTIRFQDSSAKLQIATYSNGLCRGSAIKTESSEHTTKVLDFSTATHVILELKNKSKTELQTYRQTLEVKIGRTNQRTMETKIIGLTIWENGKETALSESDFGSNREVTYSR